MCYVEHGLMLCGTCVEVVSNMSEYCVEHVWMLFDCYLICVEEVWMSCGCCVNVVQMLSEICRCCVEVIRVL